MSDVHIIKERFEWAVRRSGGKRAFALAPTYQRALPIARAVAARDGGLVIVHNPDGTVRRIWKPVSATRKMPKRLADR